MRGEDVPENFVRRHARGGIEIRIVGRGPAPMTILAQIVSAYRIRWPWMRFDVARAVLLATLFVLCPTFRLVLTTLCLRVLAPPGHATLDFLARQAPRTMLA